MRAPMRVAGTVRMIEAVVLALLIVSVMAGSGGPSLADQPLMLVYYDGHMHTVRSDGSGSVADIKATAQSRGLSAVIITDHCSSLTRAEWKSLVAQTRAASDSTFLALPGFEMTGSDGIFNRDHINALNAPDPFVGKDSDELCPEEVWPSPLNEAGTGTLYPEHLAKWVDYVEAQGGFAVHNHPSGTTNPVYGVSHLEVYNQGHVDDVAGYALGVGFPPDQALGLGLTLNNLALYGERDINMMVELPGIPTPMPLRQALFLATAQFFPPYIGQWLGAPEAPLNSWDQLLMGYVNGTIDHPIFGLANSDAHNTGDADSNVGVARNGVYLKKLTEREFYRAIQAGQTFGTTGPSLNLDVNGKLMGDRAVVPQGTAAVHVTASSENPNAVLLKIDIVKNGVVWQTLYPLLPSYETVLSDDSVTEDGYYRVEITARDLTNDQLSFAWSNPVFVKVP